MQGWDSRVGRSAHALVERLPKATDRTVVVKADKDVDMTVLVKVIDALKTAGYTKLAAGYTMARDSPAVKRARG